MQLGGVLVLVQIFFVALIGLYFWSLLRNQQGSKVAVRKDSRKEIDRLAEWRNISLSEPLAEKTRPVSFEEIIGQQAGIQALKAALCGPNPQHVIIYGPPGIGKTAAARLVLEEAKKNPASPFGATAKFIEIDGTTARFDDRGIADPLIGSVHDPIYQGAGPLGVAGIPQPKPGAVTKAHGGMLFIDEIGELHPVQMNKLLKVLEDRKVFLESAYYNSEEPNIPAHIKDIFDNGLPADFRLVGATTRRPEDIPPAIRSRCLEVYFRPLLPDEIGIIARNAARKIAYDFDYKAIEVIKKFATNGREAVNIIQTAAGLAFNDNRKYLRVSDVEWVVNNGRYAPRPDRKVPSIPQVGVANGLAVQGAGQGLLIEIEAVAYPVRGEAPGRLDITGMVEEEEFGDVRTGHKIKRKSMARGSVENVLTMLRRYLDVDPRKYDIHVNFPGGFPIDGPSAGVTIAVAVYSAITGRPVDNRVAMTGEVSLRGHVKPVGGTMAKIEAAQNSGAERVIIPKDNWQETMKNVTGVEVLPVVTFGEVLDAVFVTGHESEEKSEAVTGTVQVLSASSLS